MVPCWSSLEPFTKKMNKAHKELYEESRNLSVDPESKFLAIVHVVCD